MIALHDLSALDAAARTRLLTRVEADLSEYEAKVRPVIAAVRAEGDTALVRFAHRFDGADIAARGLLATPGEFTAARAMLAPDLLAALEFAADAIRRFHTAQMPQDLWLKEMRPGVLAGEMSRAIPSVALYVPRGKGSFPSAALMTAIPAMVAGVPDIAILTPPLSDGSLDAATLVAAGLAGVSRVVRAGGAQAVAAAAYGTASVRQAAKIVGPGSPYVAAAKRLLAHVIDTGTPAGPSEAIILAGPGADGRLAALDLLIEAEHGPDSSAFLVTWDRGVAAAALATLPGLIAPLGAERRGYVTTVLSGVSGGIVLARDEREALAFVNDYAPEHLQVLTADPFATLSGIANAGEVLLGPHTPSVLGNYVIGANHVLPTGGWARTGSALSVHDFLRRMTVARVTAEGYAALAPHARALALYEGFETHAAAVSPLRDALSGHG